jgi:hypothetical protein
MNLKPTELNEVPQNTEIRPEIEIKTATSTFL